MTTYTSGSNYQAMITLFDFLGGEVTVTLNDELADWLRE